MTYDSRMRLFWRRAIVEGPTPDSRLQQQAADWRTSAHMCMPRLPYTPHMPDALPPFVMASFRLSRALKVVLTLADALHPLEKNDVYVLP